MRLYMFMSGLTYVELAAVALFVGGVYYVYSKISNLYNKISNTFALEYNKAVTEVHKVTADIKAMKNDFDSVNKSLMIHTSLNAGKTVGTCVVELAKLFGHKTNADPSVIGDKVLSLNAKLDNGIKDITEDFYSDLNNKNYYPDYTLPPNFHDKYEVPKIPSFDIYSSKKIVPKTKTHFFGGVCSLKKFVPKTENDVSIDDAKDVISLPESYSLPKSKIHSSKYECESECDEEQKSTGQSETESDGEMSDAEVDKKMKEAKETVKDLEMIKSALGKKKLSADSDKKNKVVNELVF